MHDEQANLAVRLMRFLFSSAFLIVLLTMLSGPVMALELLMVERPGCGWCRRWNEEIAPVYPRTDEGRRAPLYRADVNDLPRGVRFRSPIVFTPTFVLIDDAREVGRITGYSSEDAFWGMLGEMLSKYHAHTR